MTHCPKMMTLDTLQITGHVVKLRTWCPISCSPYIRLRSIGIRVDRAYSCGLLYRVSRASAHISTMEETGIQFKWPKRIRLRIRLRLNFDSLTCTVLVLRMAHRIWKETEQQPGTAGPGNMLGCCLISFHFL